MGTTKLTAGQLPEGAGGRGDPEVARASVEDDIKGLSWGPDVDGSIILGL